VDGVPSVKVSPRQGTRKTEVSEPTRREEQRESDQMVLKSRNQQTENAGIIDSKMGTNSRKGDDFSTTEDSLHRAQSRRKKEKTVRKREDFFPYRKKKNKIDRETLENVRDILKRKEELRAEIASSILFADLHMPTEAKLLDNHKAYIQSWIEILKNDPKILFQAIKDAEKISDYIQEQAPIAREKIHQEKLQEENQQDYSKYIQEKIKDDFLNERVSEMEYRCLDEHQDWINDKFDAYKKGNSEEEKSATYETLRDAILINAGFRLIHENQEVLSSDASIMNEGIVGMGFEDEGISF